MDIKITMKDRVLEHLEKYGTITSIEAIKKYGCTRLSHYIYLLRNEDYNIISDYKKIKTRYGEPATIAVYTLIRNEEKKDEK